MTKEKCNKGEQCVMCLMPKKSDDGVRENKNFCSYCFRDGKVCFEGNKKDFVKMCEVNMKKIKIPFLKRKFFGFMISTQAPWWKKNFDKAAAIKGE